MRTRIAAALLALAAASAARAEPVLALRLGVAQAVGSAAADVPIGDTIPLQLPVQLDALWSKGPFAGGLYGSWGPARAGACGADATCSAWIARVGLQATWTFATGGGAAPWVGLASGYEWAREARTRGGTVTTTFGGLEPLALQGGVEWRLARWLALGPYGAVSAGWYSRQSVDTGFASASAEIPDQAVHVWFHLGVRLRLVFQGKPR